MVFKGRDNEIAEILETAGVITRSQAQAFLKQAFEQSRDFCECVLSAASATPDELLHCVARHLDLSEKEDFKGSEIQKDRISSILPRKFALKYGVLLLGESDDAWHVAAVDPFDHEIEMDLGHYLQKRVIVYVADPDWVKSAIDECYPISELEKKVDYPDREFSETSMGLETSATLIDYVDALLQKSIQDGASDIHFEPFEHRFRIRYRVDGNLKEIPSHSDHLGAALISRIKVMAQLNIAETRVPQDGRIQLHTMGRVVDLRVSTLPTQFGESVVLRILDKTRVNLDLDMLGIPEDILSSMRVAIHSPNGIFLATGPTGSGKTTTLYSALRELNQPGSKLLTIEDPVEYDIEGIVQVQTNALIGLDFSRALRSFLRHDPDKILLGEIRDTETARIAVQASLTGHMVFSSLHTNDAAGAVTRFVDMGVEPYLVAASLVAVLAQRLLRRLNPSRSEPYRPEDWELFQLGFGRSQIGDDGVFFRPQKQVSGESGYQGRVGLYEYIRVNDLFREAITSRRSHVELAALAKKSGMRDLRDDGLRTLRLGLTSVEEILRYT